MTIEEQKVTPPDKVIVVGHSGLEPGKMRHLVRAISLSRRLEAVLASDIEISVKAIIFNQVGEVLVLKDSHSAWNDLPGGHLNDGEDALQGLCREVREETRLNIGDIKPKLTTALKLGRRKRPVQFFTATALHIDVQLSDEHSDYKWVRPESLSGYNLGVFLNPTLQILRQQGAIQGAEPRMITRQELKAYTEEDPHHEAARRSAERIYRAAVDDWLSDLNAKLLSTLTGKKDEDILLVYAPVIEEAEAQWPRALGQAATRAYATTAATLGSHAEVAHRPSPEALRSFASSRRSALARFPRAVDEKLRASLQRGLEGGEDARALARRLGEAVAEVHDGAGRRVAATEAQVTYGVAQSEVLKAAGFQKKRWHTVGDDRVRDSHYLCESQGAIPVGATFQNGLLYPGDPNGPPEEVINCRCNLVGVA